MRKLKYVLISSILAILLIITIPIIIISYTLLPYNIIHYSKEYNSYQDPTTVDILNIDVDIGDVEVIYISYAIDFSVKIDIEFELSGIILKGVTFSDFFSIKWLDTGNALNFSMHIKDGIILENLISQLRIKKIIVLLKANLNCDISVLIQNGNFAFEVIYGITVGSIYTNISRGNIQYDFNSCYINGNITAKSQNGDINLESSECQYFKNSIWLLSTEKGNVFINLDQNDNLGANITGTISTFVGNYRISYIDHTTEVGALFILEVNQSDNAIHQQLIEMIGFNSNLTSMNGNDVYHVYSDDFPANTNYNLTFTIPMGVYEDLYFRNLLN